MAINHEAGIDVELGGETFRVIAQRQARVLRKLFGSTGVFASVDKFADALDQEGGFDAQMREVGGFAYDVLLIFIPDLMPRWQWDGYASQTAADSDQYDEEADRSPTFPEISNAFKTAIQVNGVEWLTKIKDVIDPKLLKAQVNAWLAAVAKRAGESMERSSPSESLQPPSGISGLTSSGPNGPTAPSPSPRASHSA